MAPARILLVEDEVLIRLVAAEILQEEGFEVVEAWDGSEAIRLLNGPDRFDVLFTDVRMPGGFDGIDVAMHARHRYPAIPILVVSGYAVQLETRLGPLKPPLLFVGKPYRLDNIVASLRSLSIQT